MEAATTAIETFLNNNADSFDEEETKLLHILLGKAQQQPPSNQPKCVIILEGLDGVGKTTQWEKAKENLSKKFGEDKVIALRTPPPLMKPLRAFFDQQDEVTRRHFYQLGNYLVSNEMLHCGKEYVIVDRLWPSTIAYQEGTKSFEFPAFSLPAKGSTIYSWPKDMNKPANVHIVLLTVSEEARKERIRGRDGENITKEEAKLKESEKFRESVLRAYRNIDGIREIDTSAMTKEEISEKVLEVCGI